METYQYEPYDTTLTIIPFNDEEECRPIELTVLFEEDKEDDNKWKFMTASFDLTDLPFCPKNLLLIIQGGKHGWEFQVSKIKITSPYLLNYLNDKEVLNLNNIKVKVN